MRCEAEVLSARQFNARPLDMSWREILGDLVYYLWIFVFSISLLEIVGIFAVMFGAGCGPSDGVTIYPVACEGTVVNGECRGGLGITLNPSTLHISSNRQEVWVDDNLRDLHIHEWAKPLTRAFLGALTVRLSRCRVIDVHNWECVDSTERHVSMTDGQLVAEPPYVDFFSSQQIAYVSWWRWSCMRRMEGFVWDGRWYCNI